MLVAFVIPTYRTYKQTGINPITFGKNDNAHDYIGFIMNCLLYTSDAADERSSVDLGGRRIIKKQRLRNVDS